MKKNTAISISVMQREITGKRTERAQVIGIDKKVTGRDRREKLNEQIKKWLEVNLPVILMIYDGEFTKWDDMDSDNQAGYMNESESVISEMNRTGQFSEV